MLNRTSTDARFRALMSPAQAELLTEYETCTKRRVTLNYDRLAFLAVLVQRDHTRDDVATIVRYIRRRIHRGDNRQKVGTFTPASLEFGNIFGDYARFEDRLQTAREELTNKRIVNGKIVQVTHALGNGEVINRLEEVRPERATEAARGLVAAALRGILEGLEKP